MTRAAAVEGGEVSVEALFYEVQAFAEPSENVDARNAAPL